MDAFLEVDPAVLGVPDRQQLLISAVAPRPIALTGTQDREGRANLSPFSFFNVFGSNPACLAISPALSGRTGEPKHTLQNVLATEEFTVSIVNHAMVEQASLASGAFARGVDEFVKAGFTKRPSRLIAPPGVAESPCILECRLLRHLELGGKPASGNLLIGEVVQVHLRREILDGEGRIDPYRMDPVARLGADWYTRAREGLFELAKPPTQAGGVGFDRLPRCLLESKVLTGNDLARLAGVLEIPEDAGPESDALLGAIAEFFKESEEGLHRLIQGWIRENKLAQAWLGARFLARAKGEAW